MSFNPNNSRHQERLERAIQHSRLHLAPFRQTRLQMLKEYVGSNWGLGGANMDVIANFMQQMAIIYVQRLSGGMPRADVSSDQSSLMPFAYRFKQAINNIIKEIHLKTVIQRSVLDSFFTIGLSKVHLKSSPRLEMTPDIYADPGKLHVASISFDQFLLDTRCDHWDRRRYAGDMYRVDYDLVMQNTYFDKEAQSKLKPTSKYARPNEHGHTSTLLSGGRKGDADEIVDMLDLCDLHFPMENLVATWPVLRGAQLSLEGKPLLVRQWDGPERGPYHKLGLIPVVDSPMDAAPGQGMLLLHQTLNSVLRKLVGQSARQRDIPIFGGGAEHDARNVMGAADGEWTGVQSAEDIDIIKMGGVDQGNAAFFSSLMLLADRMGGNLSTMGGLGTQAETLGQEQMLGQQIAESESAYHEAVLDYVQGILEDLGLLLWHDPVMEIPSEIRLPGNDDISVDNSWTPEMREGDVWQYNFAVEPYSLQHKSPNQVIASIMQVLTQLLIPAQGELAQVGGRLNWQKITGQLADLLDLPWLSDIIEYDQPIGDRPGLAGVDQKQAPHTVRESVRRNVPTGGTQNSQWQQQQMSWNDQAGQTPSQKMSMGAGAA